MLGFLLAAICTISLPFTKTFALLLFTQAFNGFARRIDVSRINGAGNSSVSEDRRASAMGFFQAVYSLGMFGGPFIAGWIGGLAGLSGGFIIVGSMSLVGVFLALRWIPEMNNEKASLKA